MKILYGFKNILRETCTKYTMLFLKKQDFYHVFACLIAKVLVAVFLYLQI